MRTETLRDSGGRKRLGRPFLLLQIGNNGHIGMLFHGDLGR